MGREGRGGGERPYTPRVANSWLRHCLSEKKYHVLSCTWSRVSVTCSSVSSSSSLSKIHPVPGGSQTGGGDRRRARSPSVGHLSKRCGEAMRSAARSRTWRARMRDARQAMRGGCVHSTSSLKRMLRLTACDAVARATYGRLIYNTAVRSRHSYTSSCRGGP